MQQLYTSDTMTDEPKYSRKMQKHASMVVKAEPRLEPVQKSLLQESQIKVEQFKDLLGCCLVEKNHQHEVKSLPTIKK